MEVKTICFLCFKFAKDWSGIALSARRIVGHLLALGYRVHIVTPVKTVNPDFNATSATFAIDGTYCSAVELEPRLILHEIAILNEHGRLPVISFQKICKAIEILNDQYRFDLYHAFTFSAVYFTITVAKKNSTPIIGSFRGVDGHTLLGSQHLLPYLRSSLKAVDWITSVSSDLIRNVNRLEAVQKKSSVIFNGIDYENMPSWSIGSCNRGVIGTAAELRYKKGIHLLPSIFAMLDPKRRSAIHVIGQYSDDVERLRVASEIDRIGIANNWVYSGYLPRDVLLTEICKFHIFIIPSLHDGLPNALLEACSCGIPIVAANVSGMADVLTHGVDALLCEPGNPSSFSAAVDMLLASDALCQKLSEGAKKLALHLNTRREKQQWQQLYNRFLNA